MTSTRLFRYNASHMAMIHVSRSGATLGIFEEEKVREGLGSGEFIGTDLGWMEGMATWRPLAELNDFRTPPPPPPVTPVEPVSQTGATLAPAGVVPASARTGLPWENRGDSNWLNAAVDTLQMVLLRPTEAFSVMRREGNYLDPLLYTVILGMVGALISFAFSFGLQSLGFNWGREQGLGALVGMGFASIFMLVLVPVFIVVFTFLAAGIVHVCLMIVGGANQPFETTFRVICFGAGSATIIQIVPVCGGMISVIYSLVLECIGLARTHETDTWRAVVAVMLPLVVCCGGSLILFILFIGGLAGAANWH